MMNDIKSYYYVILLIQQVFFLIFTDFFFISERSRVSRHSTSAFDLKMKEHVESDNKNTNIQIEKL